MVITEAKVRVAFIKWGTSYLYEIGKKNPGGCALEFTTDQTKGMKFADKTTALIVRDHLQEEGYADIHGETLPLEVRDEEIGIALNL